jgi:hypothetical protein
MKAMMRGKIEKMSRDERGETVTIMVDVTGSVEKERSPAAKPCGAEITLRLKPVVADELRFGQVLYVTVSDVPPPTETVPLEDGSRVREV